MAGLDVICIGAVNYDYMFRCTAEDLITDESEGAEDLSNSTELVERDIRELIRKDREYTTQLGGSAFITLKVIKYIFMHMKTAYVGVCGGLSDFELRFGKTNDLETELEHLDNREWFFTTENRFDRPENRYVAKSVVRLYNHSRNCIRIAPNANNTLLERIRAYKVEGVVRKTSSAEIREYPAEGPGTGKRVALLDTGTKRNIIRSLQSLGCSVTVCPWNTPAENILAWRPDGIMLSNGPGDPKEEPGLIAEVRKLALSGIPLFAICLGHQLTALAMGGDTARLKFGHRGANQPVKDLRTGRVYITSQNHGYAVVNGSLPETVAVPAFVNLNDGTNEGLRYVKQNILTVQFHPEASPGPGDAGELFREFLRMMEEK